MSDLKKCGECDCPPDVNGARNDFVSCQTSKCVWHNCDFTPAAWEKLQSLPRPSPVVQEVAREMRDGLALAAGKYPPGFEWWVTEARDWAARLDQSAPGVGEVGSVWVTLDPNEYILQAFATRPPAEEYIADREDSHGWTVEEVVVRGTPPVPKAEAGSVYLKLQDHMNGQDCGVEGVCFTSDFEGVHAGPVPVIGAPEAGGCEPCHICKKRKCESGEGYCSAVHFPDRAVAALQRAERVKEMERAIRDIPRYEMWTPHNSECVHDTREDDGYWVKHADIVDLADTPAEWLARNNRKETFALEHLCGWNGCQRPVRHKDDRCDEHQATPPAEQAAASPRAEALRRAREQMDRSYGEGSGEETVTAWIALRATVREILDYIKAQERDS